MWEENEEEKNNNKDNYNQWKSWEIGKFSNNLAHIDWLIVNMDVRPSHSVTLLLSSSLFSHPLSFCFYYSFYMSLVTFR